MLQQYVQTTTLVPTVATMILMTPGHDDGLVPRKNATDLHGPMRCSALTPEREEHLLNARGSHKTHRRAKS
jgi:hypothetical protein